MSRSQNRIIEIKKSINHGHLPTFLSMMHRHLEKEQPEGTIEGIANVGYELPIDLLGLTVVDKSLLKDISSVTLTYRTK